MDRVWIDLDYVVMMIDYRPNTFFTLCTVDWE